MQVGGEHMQGHTGRTILAAVAAASLTSILVTFLALRLLLPAAVSAQQPSVPQTGTMETGARGSGLRSGTGPGFYAGLRVIGADGRTPRAEIAAGGDPARGGTAPEEAGFNLFAPDGTLIGRLGTDTEASAATNLILNDRQGNARVQVRVDEDGVPSIRLLAADGSIVWQTPQQPRK